MGLIGVSMCVDGTAGHKTLSPYVAWALLDFATRCCPSTAHVLDMG